MPFEASPLTAFTLIAAPAVLTNAAAVLVMSTSNRFSRTLDRARSLANQLASQDLPKTQRKLRLSQFERAQIRAFLLLKALSSFYVSLATFAITSAISVIGVAASAIIPVSLIEIGPWAAVWTSSIGVGMLAIGCVFLVRETRLAVQSITEEEAHLRSMFLTTEIDSPTID